MATTKIETYPTVSVTKTVTVYPKILRPQKVMNLSNLDRQCPINMYLVFFYKPSIYQSLSVDSVFDSFKSGLEETLSIWYPVAGRLSLNPIDGKLNLDCNNKGAILVQAETQIGISELGDLSQYNQFLENLVYRPHFDGDFSQMPLLVAQMTKLGCGSYSIGIGTNHSIFDGPAAYDFLKAWASNSDIMKEKKGSLEVFKPVHERDSLMVVEKTMSHNNQIKTMATTKSCAAAIDHLYQLIMRAAIDDENLLKTESLNIHYKSIVFKTFHLSSDMIESCLKKVLVLDEKGSIGFSCSSFEVVAAHLWKARTKALGTRKKAMVCLQFAVDVRNKVVPPLPSGYSGNAYVLASIAISTRELEQATYKTIIKKIREAKNNVNNEYVKAYIEGLEGPQTSLPPLKELTLVSDWTRMPFHKINFLQAEAAYVSPLVPPIPQVACLMQNPNDNKAIDVRIGLFPQYVDAFSRYFLNIDWVS